MKKYLICVLCVLGMSTTAFPVIDVAAIHLDIESLTWFHAGSPSKFAFENLFNESQIMIEAGDLRSAGSTAYDYAFEGYMSITPSDMLMNGSSGGLAGGLFSQTSASVASTMTVTVTRMWKVSTGLDVINSPSGVTLLAAQMQNPAPGYWIISETETYSNFLSGTALYQITGGEVKQADILRMSDFQATYQFPNCGSNITNMTSDIGCGEPAIILVANSVPEPVTLLFLVFGSVILRKRKTI